MMCVCALTAEAAGKAEVHTKLAARVLGWQLKIQPMLDEQVAAGEFDIHKVLPAFPAMQVFHDIVGRAQSVPPLSCHCLPPKLSE